MMIKPASTEPSADMPANAETSAVDAQKAIWIASYPKSGNTWVRVFVHNLIGELRGNGGRSHDINALHEWTARESVAPAFERRLGKPVRDADAAEIAAIRPLVQADVAALWKKPILIKTHNAFAVLDGHATINLDVTLAAIYIVRNPLDVAVSYSHHLGLPLDATIAMMARRDMTSATTERHVFEFLGSWSAHVASWLSIWDRPVLVLRYEDMLGAPNRTFGRLASFLGLAADAAQLQKAIDSSSFEKLAQQERRNGFVERPEIAERFFREGRAGQWTEALSQAQIAALVAAHAPMMMRFGYLPERCGASV